MVSVGAACPSSKSLQRALQKNLQALSLTENEMMIFHLIPASHDKALLGIPAHTARRFPVALLLYRPEVATSMQEIV